MTKPVLVAVLAATAGALKVESAIKEQTAEECTCLQWKDAYKSHGATCGDAKELTAMGSAPKFVAKMMVGEEFCGKFFQRIQDNFCVSARFNHQEVIEKQWCYVSSKCQNLGAGNAINDKVSWKTCSSSDSDKMMNQMTPVQLADMAVNLDLDLGLMAKFSWQVPKKWSEATTEDIEKAKSSYLPKLFDSDNGHPPFRAVYGGKVYKIDFLPAPDGMQAYLKGRMGKVNGLSCESGC